MKIENLRSLIREGIAEWVKEMDMAAEAASHKARITSLEEAIATRETKLNNMTEGEHADYLDQAKIKELQNEIKELKKHKAKFEKAAEKQAAKHAKKSAPKEEEVVTDAMTEDAPIDETDVMAEMDVEEVALNESFLKMQKLAGVITEAEYNQKKSLVENQINEFDMDQFSLGSAPKASFEDKWNVVPNANKEVLKKSTGKEPILIMASSKGSNHLVAKGSDNKFYLYTFTQAANPGEPKGPFNSEEDAKKQVK